MPAMRKFTCYDCNKTFEVPYGTGVPGRAMKCPECGSSNLHRAESDRGFGRLGSEISSWKPPMGRRGRRFSGKPRAD